VTPTDTWGPWEPVSEYDFKEIIFEKKEHLGYGAKVARVTFNRPERLNSLTNVTMEEMATALDDASHDASVGVTVLTGSGDRAFCAGGDVQWEAAGGLRRQFYHELPPNHFLRLSRKPVIAAVRGYAIGAGNHLAYFADFTIAAENAIFGQAGPRVGSPADGYIVAYLTRVVGAKKAREIWMLCRKYNASQALEMGLVNSVVPLDQVDAEVDKFCEEILEKSPTCIQILKASFDADIDSLVCDGMRLSALMSPDFFSGPEVKEGQQAFLEKRPVNFWKAIRDHQARLAAST
jgi:naphthoate synthase